MKQKIVFTVSIIFMIILIIFPQASSSGVKDGLMLWYKNIIPSLFPYMIITNIIIRTNVLNLRISSNSQFFNKNVLFSILVGFLCGYPMGAYFVSRSYLNGSLSRNESLWLLSFVNISSPAFIIQFIVISSLNNIKLLLPLCISIYSSAIITGIILYFYYRNLTNNNYINNIIVSNKSNTDIISDCIMDAIYQILKLGAYIIIFSVITKMVTAHISTVTQTIALIIGCIEITNGISLTCSLELTEKILISIITFITTFGSLSCIMQTYSVISCSKLPILPYVYSKIFQALLSVIIISLQI